MFTKYFSEFKEFKVEDLLGDTLPSYFIYTDIEQILKIDVQSLLTDQLIQDINDPLKEVGYKPPRYYYMHN